MLLLMVQAELDEVGHLGSHGPGQEPRHRLVDMAAVLDPLRRRRVGTRRPGEVSDTGRPRPRNTS